MLHALNILIDAFFVMVALSIGSFLNVVIYRLPIIAGLIEGDSPENREKLSLAFPPSHCPSCDVRLKWYWLIPILSYVFLRGKCSRCSVPISPQYPLVEAATAGLAIILLASQGASLEALYVFIVCCLFICAGMIDFRTGFLPDILIIVLTVLGLSHALLDGAVAFSYALIGALVGGAVCALIAIVGKFFLRRDCLGLGDIKYLCAIGAILGWQGIYPVLMFACIFGVFGYFYIRRVTISSLDQGEIPFGPYLSLAAIIWILFGKYISNIYLKMFF